jgi:hypothetical protein
MSTMIIIWEISLAFWGRSREHVFRFYTYSACTCLRHSLLILLHFAPTKGVLSTGSCNSWDDTTSDRRRVYTHLRVFLLLWRMQFCWYRVV